MRPSRASISLLALALSVILLSGCSGAVSLDRPKFAPGTTMSAIQDSGYLIAGVKYDQPAFGLVNAATGQPEGFDVDVATYIAQGIFGGTKAEAAKHIRFVQTISSDREANIENGTVDVVVATYTITPERRKVVDFAGPYFVAHQDVMVNSNNDSIRTLQDLAGKRVCTVTGSTSATALQAKVPDVTLALRDTYSECTQDLYANQVDAVTTDNAILAEMVLTSHGAFKRLKLDFTDEPYGVGFKKGDTAFGSFINSRLNQTFDDGEWATAYSDRLAPVRLETTQPKHIDLYWRSCLSCG